MIDYRLIFAFLFVLSGHVNAQTNNRLEKELDDMTTALIRFILNMTHFATASTMSTPSF